MLLFAMKYFFLSFFLNPQVDHEANGQVMQHNIFLALLHYRTASPFCSLPASPAYRIRSGSCRPDRLRAR